MDVAYYSPGGVERVHRLRRCTTDRFLQSSGPREPRHRLQTQSASTRYHDLQPAPLQVTTDRRKPRMLSVVYHVA